MIHAYAIEPELAATWVSRSDLRYFRTSFGLGTPRMLLELPKFTKWRSKVLKAAESQGMTEMERERLTALLATLGEYRCKRPDARYDGNLPWLENAEAEHVRRPFAAILAQANPRDHQAVLVGSSLGSGADPRWDLPTAATPERTPAAVADALRAMLENCREVLFIDPYFLPGTMHRAAMVERLLHAAARGRAGMPARIEIHCSAEKCPLHSFLEEGAREEMADHLPAGLEVRFRRWQERAGGERFHNRYILTDIGGVTIGGGLEKGDIGQSDDINLMNRAQYEKRWAQFSEPDKVPFVLVDEPAPVRGQGKTRRRPGPERR